MTEPDKPNVLIVLGHGSRHEEGLKVVTETADRLRGQLGEGWIIDVAYMELARPTLEETLAKILDEADAGHVVIMPLFLSLGAHVSLQLPSAVEQLKADYPGQSIVVARHIGADPLLCDIVLGRVHEVFQNK